MMNPDANGWLQYELKFTEADLAANREGRLSDDQIEMLKDKLGDRLGHSIIGHCLMAVFLALLMGIYVLLQSQSYQSCFYVSLVIATWWGLDVGWSWLKGFLELRQKRIESIDLTVEEPPPQFQDILHIHLALQSDRPKLRLIVPSMYFEKGEAYRLYYMKRTKVIVSAEKVGPEIDDIA